MSLGGSKRKALGQSPVASAPSDALAADGRRRLGTCMRRQASQLCAAEDSSVPDEKIKYSIYVTEPLIDN